MLFSFWGSEGTELLMHPSRGSFLIPSLFSSPHALAAWEGEGGSLLEPSSHTSFESSPLGQMQGLTGDPWDRTHKLDAGSESSSTVLLAFRIPLPWSSPSASFFVPPCPFPFAVGHLLTFLGGFPLFFPPFRGFPGGASGKEPACQCWRCRRHGFDPWVGEIPWRRAWLPRPVFLSGESHGQRSLAGHSPRGSQRVGRYGMSEQLPPFSGYGRPWRRKKLLPQLLWFSGLLPL